MGSVREILSRLTGFSTPWGGLDWVPPASERDAANALVVFLFDRRVLYVPAEAEVAHHAVQSVLEIRKELTDIAKKFPVGGDLEVKIRAMRSASNHFLNRVGRDEEIVRSANSGGHWANFEFMDALGQWRAFMAVYLGMVCSAYEISPPQFLIDMLPAQDERLRQQILVDARVA